MSVAAGPVTDGSAGVEVAFGGLDGVLGFSTAYSDLSCDRVGNGGGGFGGVGSRVSVFVALPSVEVDDDPFCAVSFGLLDPRNANTSTTIAVRASRPATTAPPIRSGDFECPLSCDRRLCQAFDGPSTSQSSSARASTGFAVGRFLQGFAARSASGVAVRVLLMNECPQF